LKTVANTYFIEDNIIFTIVFQKIFESCKGLFDDLNIFANPKIALDALRETDSLPDLILLDINMPVLNGWEFLDAIKENEKFLSIPIYILTSSINDEDKTKAKEYPNIKDYIVKPLTREKLVSIHTALTS
jgi:CheY-like chemotaxis protein